MYLFISEIGKTLLWVWCFKTITLSKREDVLWRNPFHWLHEQWGIGLRRTGGPNYWRETQSFGRISDQKTSMGENYAGKCEDKTRSGSQKHLNTTCQTNGKVKACGRSLRKAGTWRSIMGCAVTTDQLFWMRTIYVELCYTWLLVVFLEILLEIKSPLNCCHYIIYISVMCGLWEIKPF